MRLTIRILIFGFCLSITAFGQQAKLEGRVFDDKDRYASGVRIIAPGGQPALTDNKGHFSISFPVAILPGQAASIKVVRLNWVVYQPMFGNCVTQSAERNYEPLRVVIVPKGSPLAFSPKRLSQVIGQWTAERARQRVNVENLKQNLDEYAFLRKYAKDYGFTLDQFKVAADQWAKIKDSDDQEERALKAYWQKDYGQAAQLAHESAQAADQELDQANIKTNEASLKVIRRYLLAGNANYAQYKFREALNAYNEIGKRFETGALSKEKFIAEWAETGFHIAHAKTELGVRVEGEEGLQLLKEALAENRRSETFYTRAQSPRDWASTQNNLGNVLQSLGERISGSESTEYLNEAVLAYRAALEIRTRAQFPQDWAATQTNLGVALWNLGRRLSGAESIKYLNEAVVTHRAALEVSTRARSPEDWAVVQINLGSVLLSLGERASGAKSVGYLNEARAAYRAALEVFTREELPQRWGVAQHNLGTVLRRLGERVSGAESSKYLSEAVVAFRAALEVRTREQLPQDWALTQSNLVPPLIRLGERASGAEAVKYLNEALAASRAALEVSTRDHFPQQWALAQANLGQVLASLGERASEAEQVNYLNDAVAASRDALKIFTPEEFPQRWAAVQTNLGMTYLQLHDWSAAEEASANLFAHDPNNRGAYSIASRLYHEKLFNFDKAFVLNQQWLTRHPEDISAQANFAEAHFTVGRFADSEKRISALLTKSELPAGAKSALRAIEIASLLADSRATQVPVKIDALIEEVTLQPAEFKTEWSFEGVRHFINQSQLLSQHRVWLGQLFDALEKKDRDTILKALREVRAEMPKQSNLQGKVIVDRADKMSDNFRIVQAAFAWSNRPPGLR